MTQINEYALVAGSILGLMSQVAALIGKPKIVEAIKPLSMLVDLLAGNYGKAKNAK